MKVWMGWVQDGDQAPWLEFAWDDESTAVNRSCYDAEVDRVTKMCAEDGYSFRVMAVEVPGVSKAFEIPSVSATSVEVVEP